MSSVHNLFPTLNRLKQADIARLAQEGIFIKRSKFSKDEDERIKKNFTRFLKKYDLDDDNSTKFCLLGFFRYSNDQELKKQRKMVKKLITATRFYLKLGKGLEDRSLYSIYHRARKILTPLRKAREMTQEEKDQIVMDFVKSCSRRWTEYAEKYNCFPPTAGEVVIGQVDSYGQAVKKGPFDVSEEKALIMAICELSKVEHIKDALNVTIPWPEVQERMKYRTARQCRLCWYNLRTRISEYVMPVLLNIVPYSALDSQRFIYVMYKDRDNYTDMSNVDWDWIKSKFQYVGTLDVILRWWWTLLQDVPEPIKSASLHEKVNWLYEDKIIKSVSEEEMKQLHRFYKED